METRKMIITASLVWMAGLLGIILFHDIFAISVLGTILGVLMVAVTLVALYFVIDGILTMTHQYEEQQSLLQRAYEDKMMELLGQEMEKLHDHERAISEQLANLSAHAETQESGSTAVDEDALHQLKDSINKTTMQAAKLIVKYSKSSSKEIGGKLDQLLDESKDS